MVTEHANSNVLIIVAQREPISIWFTFKLKPPQIHCYEHAPKERDTVYWSELNE